MHDTNRPSIFRDYYFTAVSWVRSDAVAVIWMNRAQNISLVTECNQPTWICRVVSIIGSAAVPRPAFKKRPNE